MGILRALSGHKRVALVVVIVLVSLTAVGTGGWYYYTQYLQAQTANGEEVVQTATVRQGNLNYQIGRAHV